MRLLLSTILLLFISTVVAAQQSDRLEEKDKIIQLEKKWTILLDNKDTTALREIFTKDYVVNNAMGRVVGVKDIFRLLKNGHIFPRVERNIERITFNNNLAIVIGGEIEYGPNNAQKNRRFTNVWIEINDTWKLAARQATGN